MERRTVIWGVCIVIPWLLVITLVAWLVGSDARNASVLDGLFSETSAVTWPTARRLVLVDRPGDQWCQIWCPANSDASPPVIFTATPTLSPTTTVTPNLGSRSRTGASSPGHTHVATHTAKSAVAGSSAVPGVSDSGDLAAFHLLTERVMASMTLAAVAFQMSLFYVINHRDDDIKRYSLSVIGQTISIFCAVLAFDAIYGVVEQYLEDVRSTRSQALACPLFCVFFFVAMEVTVLVAARVRGEKAQKHVTLTYSRARKTELLLPSHVLNAKTFGAGAAQLCAAASIRGFGHLQMLAYESEHSVVMVCLVCPLVFCGLFLTAMMIGRVRSVVILWDGVVDEAEKTWIRVAEECEDEVIALASGFHCAVAIRVILTDSLPFVLLEGFEHRETLEVARTQDLVLLWLTALACAFLCIVLNWVAFGILSHGINMVKLRSDSVSRFVRVLTQCLGMTFAWLLCFGTHLLALHIPHATEGLELRLEIALFQSFASFIIIVVLDFISDMKYFGPAFDKSIIMVICSLGASVGLTWEQAFHTCAEVAVDFMAEDETSALFRASDDPKIWSLALSGTIIMAVLPAYRFYIVPRMYQMIEEHDAELHQKETEFRVSEMGGKNVLSEKMFIWSDDTQLEMIPDGDGTETGH